MTVDEFIKNLNDIKNNISIEFQKSIKITFNDHYEVEVDEERWIAPLEIQYDRLETDKEYLERKTQEKRRAVAIAKEEEIKAKRKADKILREKEKLEKLKKQYE
jgi:uncharacterized protein YqfA (UPF0365 family)